MFTIGEMARICGVSAKTLRYYEAEGLLSPARIDAHNQYRYYSPDQVLPLRRILFLREMGLGVEVIRRLVEGGAITDPAGLQAVMEERAATLRREIADREAQLERIAALQVEQAVPTQQPVTLKEVPAMQVVSVRRVVSVDAIPDLLEEARRLAKGRPAGYSICLFHNPEFDPDQVDAEALCPVAEGGWTLPGAQVAAVIHEEPGHDAGRSYERLYAWVQEHGYTPVGLPRELFLSEPDAERLVIEIQCPVERRAIP